MKKYGGFFDLDSKTSRLRDINDSIAANPNFWNDPAESAPVLKEKKQLEDRISAANELKSLFEDFKVAIDLAGEGEEEFLIEAATSLESLKETLAAMEIESLLNQELDSCDAILTINAGAGGTESCDWANMILRMFLRFSEQKGFKAEIVDIQDGEEAGIKSATIEIEGPFAYGLLKAESGVHRLVRISPFDSNARRHTSFCSVYASAVVDEDIDVEIKTSDLRIDTYRASGAGGQHVNRTDSAVRITHLPTNTVVQSQSQRSQHQNRDTAMKHLRSKLYELELEKRREKQSELEDAKSDIAFGSQIRSYILHPYKMVKDHRTSHESRSPDEVLDGGIGPFINAMLIQSRKPTD